MMALPLKQIKDILDKVFTDNGYSVKDLNVKFKQPLNITFGTDGNNISLIFTKNLPCISWKRFITISAWIEGLILSNTGGTIKIKYFPDLQFTYSEKNEQLFGKKNILDLNSIEEEIKAEYPDEERRKLANVCLQYANEWVTMCCASGVTSDDFRDKKHLRKDCYNFVRDCIKKEEKYGSVVGFIVLFIILPVVLRWIIEKIFDRLVS